MPDSSFAVQLVIAQDPVARKERPIRRDGKPRYRDFLPRVEGYFRRDLARPELAPVRAFFAGRIADMAAEIRNIVGAKGPDKVIETTGAKSVIELAYDITHPDGTCVLVGVPSEKVTIYTLPIHFNKVLTGSHGGDAVPHVDIPRLIRLNEAGRLSFGGLITHEFRLDDINAALDTVRSGTAGRVLVDIAGA